MKSKLISIAGAALVALALPAASASAAPHGGGFHGGGTRVIISGGWGWGWGSPYWGWYGPGYYGYYGYPYRAGYAGYAESWGAVKTDVQPEEARVYLDGKYIGTADDFDGWPDKLYLRPGRYRLEFRLSGYEPKSVEVVARNGRTLDIDDKLVRSAGHRESDPPKLEGDVQRYFGKQNDRDGARPYMRREARGDDGPGSDEDGAIVDRDRDQNGDRDRDADRDRDRARDGDNSWRNSRRPDSEVQARPVRGERSRLRIKVEPSDAVVYLDNRFVGSAEEVSSMERGIVVAPGKHKLTVSRPGFRDETKDVTIEAGKTERIEIELAH